MESGVGEARLDLLALNRELLSLGLQHRSDCWQAQKIPGVEQLGPPWKLRTECVDLESVFRTSAVSRRWRPSLRHRESAQAAVRGGKPTLSFCWSVQPAGQSPQPGPHWRTATT